MQIRSSKNSCMGKENRLYSISLGVASLQGGLVGVATALSPATCRPFQVFSPSFFVGLGLDVRIEKGMTASKRGGIWSRRDFLTRMGWAGFGFVSLAALLGFIRSAFPRVLFQPPSILKVGLPSDYALGEVSEKYKQDYRVWIV